jgi:hypothetical protein
MRKSTPKKQEQELKVKKQEGPKPRPLLYPETVWEEHWKGMPEYVQGVQSVFTSIVVHFRSEEDLKDFAARIKQNLTKSTRSIWYPERGLHCQTDTTKHYVDAEGEE